MEKETSKLGERIKLALKMRGMTRTELQDKTFFRYHTIENWILGKTSPKVSDLIILAEALGVTVGWLVDEEPASCRYEEFQHYAKKALYWYMNKHKMPAEWYITIDEFMEKDFRDVCEE